MRYLGLTMQHIMLIAKILPYIWLLSTTFVFFLCITSGRVNLAIKGLLCLGIPVIVASIIAIWNPRWLKESPANFPFSLRMNYRRFVCLVALFFIFFAISLILLSSSDIRPITYFYIIAMMAGFIFIEILGVHPAGVKKQGIILAQIIFLFLNFTFGQTLKLPLYFGGGDLLAHMNFVENLTEIGYVTYALGDYQYFPLFHICNAIAMMMTGMDIRTSFFLFNGSFFAISIIIVYLLVKHITNDICLSLLTAIIYSLSREVIYNGMYLNTREWAFIIFLLILYLLTEKSQPLRILSILLIFPLALSHQSTLVYASALFFIFMLIELILYHRVQYVGIAYPVLFTVIYIAYWFYIAISFTEDILTMFSHTSAEAFAVPREAQIASWLEILARNIDYAILLFLALLGIESHLYQYERKLKIDTVFTLVSIVGLPFYIPLIADIFGNIFLAYRIPIMISPFIAFAGAKGVIALMPKIRTTRWNLKSASILTLILCLLLSFYFSSTVILGSSTDFSSNIFSDDGIRRYFTEGELQSFSYISKNTANISIYTDSHAQRCLEGYFHTSANGTQGVFNYESILEGYMIFRKEHFKSKGELNFLTGEVLGLTPSLGTYRVADSPNLEMIWGNSSKIFNSFSAVVYLKS